MSKIKEKIVESESLVNYKSKGLVKKQIKNECKRDYGLGNLKESIRIHEKIFEKRGLGV
jgi:hypothetical protein